MKWDNMKHDNTAIINARTVIKTFISHSGSELKLEFEYHSVKTKSVKSNTLRIIVCLFFCAI